MPEFAREFLISCRKDFQVDFIIMAKGTKTIRDKEHKRLLTSVLSLGTSFAFVCVGVA